MNSDNCYKLSNIRYKHKTVDQMLNIEATQVTSWSDVINVTWCDYSLADAEDVLGHIESVQLHQSWYKIRPGFPNLIITDLCDMNKYCDTLEHVHECNVSVTIQS